MPKPAGGARERILGAAYTLFFRRGFTRVGVDEIAEAAAVTKRTVYYHFKSKDDILAAVLDEQRPLALDRLRRFTFLNAEDTERAIEDLAAELKRWLTGGRWSGSGYTRIAFELADLPGHPARKIASVHKAEVEAVYCDFFKRIGIVEAEKRARELVVLLEGGLTLTLIHGKPDYLEAALAMVRDRLLDGPRS